MPPAPWGRFRGLFTNAALCGAFFSFTIFVTGCGAPGEPTPASPPIPAAVSDLGAQQKGDAAQLTFTVPTKTITGTRLKEIPACEVYRGEFKADGSPEAKSFRMVYTFPGTLLSGDMVDKQAQLLVPFAPEEAKSQPGHKLAYLVRARVSAKKASADSNIVALAVYPVPEALGTVEATVTESAIELRWAAVTRTSGGEPLAAVREEDRAAAVLIPSHRIDLQQSQRFEPRSLGFKPTPQPRPFAKQSLMSDLDRAPLGRALADNQSPLIETG